MRSDCVLVVSAMIVLGQFGSALAQPQAPAVTAAERSAACAPALGRPPAPGEGLRIVGGQDTKPRTLFGSRDLVVIRGGTPDGVQLDQQYLIRRLYRPTQGLREVEPTGPETIHTTGWLRIVAVNDTTAIGQVQTTCDGVIVGDYLEPFTVPPPIADGSPLTPATLDFSMLARVMFASEERVLGAAGDFMLVEAGGAALAPGTRVAVYRDHQMPGVPLVAVAQGVIVSLTDGAPLMRIISSTDAVISGDYVVPHRQ